MNLVGNEYKPFSHLRPAIFWDVDQPVAMLTFYADDAGKRDDHEYVIVAGYIGLAAQWERFCFDWRLRLAKAGLPEFHAVEFFNGAGIYAPWQEKNKARERDLLLGDLAQIINDYSLQSFTSIVYVPGWQKANESYMLEEMGFSPFPLGGRVAVQRVREWCPSSGHDVSQVGYIFDQGSDDWGRLKNRLKVDFDVDAIDEDRRKIQPLQAADWFAYEEFRETPQSDSGIRVRPVRKSLRALLRLPSDPIIFRERDFITQICTVPEMGIPARSTQGKAAVRYKFDDRKMVRVSRRYKRLTKHMEGFLEVTLPTSAKSRVQELRKAAEHASAMASAHQKLSSNCLEVMRADNKANQDSSLAAFTDEWRQTREWTEKHCDLMEQIIKLFTIAAEA